MSATERPSADFDSESALVVGRVLAPHGIRGEVKVEVLTDFPDRFDPGSRLFLDGAPVQVERCRKQGRAVVLKLEGIGDRNAAEAMRGKELLASPRDRPLDEGTYYRDDVIGLQVVDAAGTVLGRLTDILATGSNDVYVVQGPRGELLLPATDDVVLQVDPAGNRVVVDVTEGLEWHRSGAARAAGPRKRHPPRSRS